MQSNTSHDNPIFSGESSRVDLPQNRGTKIPFADLNKATETGNGVKVEVLEDSNGREMAYLTFDVHKLHPSNPEGKNNLQTICTDVRVALIPCMVLEIVEKATINNIFLGYDDKYSHDQLSALRSVINQETNKPDFYFLHFPLLSQEFIESIDS
jgi:hypothetical protein